MAERRTSNNKLTKFKSIFVKNRDIVILALVAVFCTLSSCVHYTLTMLEWTGFGFALDDSWIHLQFARTIFEGNPWEYSTGVPSTGSSSPLWAIILSALFVLTNDPIGLIIGTYIISIVFYILSSFLVGYLVKTYTNSRLVAGLAILGFVLVPRNTWLMLSGMEGPLYLFLILLVFVVLEKDGLRFDILLGFIMGLAYLARPEGVILVLVCIPAKSFVMIARKEITKERLVGLFITCVIALVVVLPWILYCMSITGFPFPDTFYAKTHTLQPHEFEMFDGWWNWWIGRYPFILLGCVTGLFLAVKGKPYTWSVAIVMWIFYRTFIPYTSLLNNARWLVPVFLLLLITSVCGVSVSLQAYMNKINVNDEQIQRLVISILILGVVITPLISSYLFQAQFFGNSVKNINEQHVVVGKWLNSHTPDNATIVVADAGATRFFSERNIIDIARLMNPEINHSNMTTIELLVFLKNRGCNYFAIHRRFFNVVYFPLIGWRAISILFEAHLEDNVISVTETLSVYYVNWSLSYIQ